MIEQKIMTVTESDGSVWVSKESHEAAMRSAFEEGFGSGWRESGTRQDYTDGHCEHAWLVSDTAKTCLSASRTPEPEERK